MGKKSNKTLFLPEWIQAVLDKEGECYDGPGVIAAASIYHFSQQKKTEKIKALEAYRATLEARHFLSPKRSMSKLAMSGTCLRSAKN